LEAVPSEWVARVGRGGKRRLRVGYGGGADDGGGESGMGVGDGKRAGMPLTAKEHLQRRLRATYGFGEG